MFQTFPPVSSRFFLRGLRIPSVVGRVGIGRFGRIGRVLGGLAGKLDFALFTDRKPHLGVKGLKLGGGEVSSGDQLGNSCDDLRSVLVLGLTERDDRAKSLG